MKWSIYSIQHEPGFRLNLVDIVFIILLIALSRWLYLTFSGISLWGIPLYLGISFFCFCNIFRIGGGLEVIWYIPFAVIAFWGAYQYDLGYLWTSGIWRLEALKWALITFRIIKGPYIGFGYSYIKE